MSTENLDLVRAAYGAYESGDVSQMLALFDSDLEWTFLDPAFEDPVPRTCRGRDELRTALARQKGLGLQIELEEVIGSGDQVVVTTKIIGVDQHRARKTGDRNFDVLTFREGRIAHLRACRSKEEAYMLVGIE